MLLEGSIVKNIACEEFTQSVPKGKMRKLQLDLKTYNEASTERVCELWKGLDASNRKSSH